jgi:hypothetical protein
VCARLEELGVARPAVRVETVDALERSPGGKLRMIVPAPSAPPRDDHAQTLGELERSAAYGDG